MRTRRFLVKCTVHPEKVRESVTVEVAAPADQVWRFMWDPASAHEWDPTVEIGATLPGSPERRAGEVQVFVRRSTPEAERTAGIIEVVELEEGRRAVTRNLGHGMLGGSTLHVEPLSDTTTRVTQELSADLPAGTIASSVDATHEAMRDELGRVAAALTNRFGPT